jgi:hypothetical protein
VDLVNVTQYGNVEMSRPFVAPRDPKTVSVHRTRKTRVSAGSMTVVTARLVHHQRTVPEKTGVSLVVVAPMRARAFV